MRRCLQLAVLGRGYTAPNPMVGAVLVYDGRIIGEGYHRQYGEAHAEVNCLRSVKDEDRALIPSSTLYVSLEPCAHFGKTPPCSDLIIENQIPEVVVGCRDPFPLVNGKGLEKLEKAGVKIISGVLEDECRELNKRFFTYHTLNRPYIILKWAQTLNGRIANEDYSRIHISNAQSNRLVHRWRSEEMAIMVGTNTALFDDPVLNTRLWPGRDPVRLVLDLNLRLPSSLKIFQSGQATIVFNLHRHDLEGNSVADLKETGVSYYQVTEDVSIIHQVLHALKFLKIDSVLVEGGIRLLQSFIDEGAWDEARIITNENLVVEGGLPAPVLKDEEIIETERLEEDVIRYFNNKMRTEE